MIEKLSSGCDQTCRREKEITLQKVEEDREEIERLLTGAEEENRKKLEIIDRAKNVFSSLSNFTREKEAWRNNPEDHKRNLLEKIEKVYRVDQLLTTAEYENLKEDIRDTPRLLLYSVAGNPEKTGNEGRKYQEKRGDGEEGEDSNYGGKTCNE